MTDVVLNNVKDKKKVDRFESYKMEHVINIKNRLDNRNFRFDNYNIFMISDPKYRIVMSQNIEDKIINHLVAKYILVDVFDNCLVDSSVATRVGKGTSYGIKLLLKYLNKLKGKNFYVLKVDISKYFYSIDHDVLKGILEKKIKDKDALDILYSIIDSTNKEYINKCISILKNNRINTMSDKNKINELK